MAPRFEPLIRGGVMHTPASVIRIFRIKFISNHRQRCVFARFLEAWENNANGVEAKRYFLSILWIEPLVNCIYWPSSFFPRRKNRVQKTIDKRQIKLITVKLFVLCLFSFILVISTFPINTSSFLPNFSMDALSILYTFERERNISFLIHD